MNNEENKQPWVDDEDEDEDEEGPIHLQRHRRTTSQSHKVIIKDDMNKDMREKVNPEDRHE